MADHIIINDGELQRLMREVAARSGNLQLWFRGYLDKSVTLMFKRHWATRGAFSGQQWKPLAPATRARRLSRRGGNRGGVRHPLWDFGWLRGSLLNPHHPEAIRAITNDTYERGTQVPYARFHHRGIPQDQGTKVPARVVIPNPPAFVVRSWEKSLVRWIEAGRI